MGKSCLDGYLTDGCKTCPDWNDGSDRTKGIGCCSRFPIAWCEHFSKMVEEQKKEETSCTK